MTTRDLFEEQISKHWNLLKERDDTIFENISIQPNMNIEFDKFKNSPYYMKVLHEESLYEKKLIIESFFWSDIVGTLYENAVGIMEKAGLLEESTRSFEKAFKIETTARLILENGIFRDFSVKKELTEALINEFFYPELIEEGFFQGAKEKIGGALSAIVKSAKLIMPFAQLMIYFNVTPAAYFTGSKIDGVQSPKERKVLKAVSAVLSGSVLAAGAAMGGAAGGLAAVIALGAPGLIWNFFNNDIKEITKYLQKMNTMNIPEVKDILKEMGSTRGQIVQKCWDRNKHQIAEPEVENLWTTFIKTYSSEGNNIQNLIRNPLFNNTTQMAMALKKDASNPKYQKMFYDFRICMYDKLFEIIIGYAQAIYSVDDASYEIIRYANDVHKRKNFKAFFMLDPKTDSEIAMFKLIKLLVAIEDMIIKLKQKKADLIADKYIDQFIMHIEQMVKQTYQTLDELAQQRSYNKSRYDEMNPADDEKVEAIRKERAEAKQSIFS